MSEYKHSRIEEKWSRKWTRDKTYCADLRTARKPYYNLMMFPYPSAKGLHVGNVYAFVGSDVHGRFMRARGFDVFEPFGFDAFGIHSENHAIQVNEHPARLTPRNVERYRELWEHMGGQGLVDEAPWPDYDAALTQEEAIDFIIQVNGKTRHKMTIARDMPQREVEAAAMSTDGVIKSIDGMRVIRKVFVPGRLLNIVTATKAQSDDRSENHCLGSEE